MLALGVALGVPDVLILNSVWPYMNKNADTIKKKSNWYYNQITDQNQSGGKAFNLYLIFDSPKYL